MTGINIPDMVQIMKEHGLVPVPIDFDIETMKPLRMDDVKDAINEKVGLIINHHLKYRLRQYYSPTCLV